MLKIVIVDDESPIREWLEYVIAQKSEFQIVGSCRSAKDALDLVASELPNVVITDIEMPGMNGLELMAAVKEINPNIKFVVLTNYADFSYAKEAIRLGTIEYLLKSSLTSKEVISLLTKIDGEFKEIKLREKKDEWFSKKITFERDVLSEYQAEEMMNILLHAGIGSKRYYQVFSMAENDLLEQISTIRQSSFEANLEYHYFQSQGYLYVIGQGDQKLELEKNISDVLKKYIVISDASVGVSQSSNDLSEFIVLTRQAKEAVLHAFFCPNQRIIYHKEIHNGTATDRKAIHHQYKEIVYYLSEENYEGLTDEVKKWYGMFARISINDLVWGIEICRSLALRFEEKGFRENETWEVRAGIEERLATINECCLACVSMIQKLMEMKKGKYSERIEEALQFMHQYFDRDLSLVEVAEHLHITPEYFSRLFKEEVGSSFSSYLITHRLKKAEFLLRNTTLTIAEISERVGYDQASYFSRIYKKYRGITPKQTREYENQK